MECEHSQEINIIHRITEKKIFRKISAGKINRIQHQNILFTTMFHLIISILKYFGINNLKKCKIIIVQLMRVCVLHK